jgi:hypothetical protein
MCDRSCLSTSSPIFDIIGLESFANLVGIKCYLLWFNLHFLRYFSSISFHILTRHWYLFGKVFIHVFSLFLKIGCLFFTYWFAGAVLILLLIPWQYITCKYLQFVDFILLTLWYFWWT